ncbi:MAG: hypothetical protein M3680_18485, partial [Myxococcota bacterium]|nr:hypothetical protein [Myxococcota bacterium]
PVNDPTAIVRPLPAPAESAMPTAMIPARSGRRSWLVPAVGGVAVLVAIVAVIGFSGGTTRPAADEPAPPLASGEPGTKSPVPEPEPVPDPAVPRTPRNSFAIDGAKPPETPAEPTVVTAPGSTATVTEPAVTEPPIERDPPRAPQFVEPKDPAPPDAPVDTEKPVKPKVAAKGSAKPKAIAKSTPKPKPKATKPKPATTATKPKWDPNALFPK